MQLVVDAVKAKNKPYDIQGKLNGRRQYRLMVLRNVNVKGIIRSNSVVISSKIVLK